MIRNIYILFILLNLSVLNAEYVCSDPTEGIVINPDDCESPPFIHPQYYGELLDMYRMIQLYYTCGGSPLDFIGTSDYVSDGNFVLAFHPLTGQIMGSSYITEPTYTDSTWSQYSGTAIPLDIYIYGDTDTDIGIVPIFKLWRDNGDLINLYINDDCDYSEETYSNNMLSIVGQCIDMSIPECYSSPLIDNGDGQCSGISSFIDCGLITCMDECDYVYGCNDPNACNYDSEIDADNGSCVDPDCTGICYGGSFFDECGICNGDGDGTDCNNDGIPDDCEEVYTSGYDAGYMNGVITGQISSDENNDGLVDDFPLITILGSTALVLTQNFEGNYVDDGASCFVGETNTSQNVHVSGDVVNLSNIGTYVISYNCQDNISGNQAMTKYRTVIVQADYSDEDNDGYDDASYIAGLEEGILLGGQSGDANGDGTLDILDIVYFIDVILNP